MNAIVVDKAQDGKHQVQLADFEEHGMMPGDVTIMIQYSTLNYKDALAVTSGAPVVRRFPMIPGIDFAGRVETSEHPAYKVGTSCF